MGRRVKPPTGKEEVKRSRSGKSPNNEGSRVRDLEKRLAEAEEQQAATAEILRVISSSPTDIKPVLDVVARSAMRLCESYDAMIMLREGEELHFLVHHGPIRRTVQLTGRAISRGWVAGRAVVDRQPVHVHDLATAGAEFPVGQADAVRAGYRTTLSVPLLREGEAIGVIHLRRGEVRPFTDNQIALLQTFAAQAVIAIENVRLFNETKEALEQQTATAEILRVISRSPTDIQPVLDAVAESAARLTAAFDVAVFLRDGDRLRLAAHHGPIPARSTLSLIRGELTGRAVLDRRTVHIADLQSEAAEYPEGSENARRLGLRTVLSVPLLREGGIALGTINLRRAEMHLFTERQVALLQTFADQAVIAIENVRLFKELQQKNDALTQAHAQVTESLEQQTATGEILRVISQSPTDVQPVFDALAESAAQLCEASDTSIFRLDGDRLRRVAHHGSIPAGVIGEFTIPLVRGSFAGRCVLDGRIVHIVDGQTEANEFPEGRQLARRLGFRAILLVPLLRDGVAIGAITLRRTEPRLFTERQVALLKTFADQAVIAIENVRLFKELEAKNRDLTTALDQQTATSEILRVISRSPTDLQPVFDSIAASALRLCDAKLCTAFRFDGELIHLVGSRHVSEEGADAYRDAYPSRPGRQGGTHRAILTGRIVHIPDIREDAEYELRALARANDYGCVLSVPMLRDGHPVGAITVGREAARPFTNAQIELLKTFADQAVIAIENVRLFTELQEKNRALIEAHSQVSESLEQQTATSEILRVISSSPTDVQPVFETIADSAMRLFTAWSALVFRYDGELLSLAAARGGLPGSSESFMGRFGVPQRPDEETIHGQTVLTRAMQHVVDVEADASWSPRLRQAASERGFRSVVWVPMLRGREAVGAIGITRVQPGGFSAAEIALLNTFADQAVIAIENVRLFTELQEKNKALTQAHAQVTEALEQQTATSEVLKVISRSAFDLQPVLENVVESATRLCSATRGHIFRFDGEVLRFAAAYGAWPEFTDYLQRHPTALDRGSVSGQAALERRTIHVRDVLAHPDYQMGELVRQQGYRAVLAVPMLREDVLLGVIALLKSEPEPFTDKQIELVTTFADQAVIAIENARLLSELRERTAELTRSVDELTALGDVARAVSSTLDLETVLNTIVSRAIQLSGTDGGSVYEYDETTEEFALRSSRDLPEAYVEQVRDTRPRKGEGAVGRVAQTREPVQIADISDPAVYESRVRNLLLQMGLRALLAVPLIAEDRLVGALIVMRKRTGTFAAEEVALLQTFATQSALAIQNARLFWEIEEKSRQLEIASQHKSEFLANMSHELRTPLNAIIGFSEVLTDRMFGELNEKQEEYLKDIYASGTHLLSLINDILDLSKIEAGRMELELTDFHLPTAIDNALMLIRERAGRRSIALHSNVDNQLGQIQADERKVRQVVLNLLSNAIKFTPEGGRIDVSAVPKGGLVEVSVRDTGIGIAPEDQEKVFEEFRQVGTAAKKVEGTGLGLTLCRKFVELHGGRIWVTSEVGVGSTFTFTLPMHRGE